MESISKCCAFIVLIFFSQIVLGEEAACLPSTESYNQCGFETPSLKHGQTLNIESSTNGFLGSATAQCRFGTLSFSEKSCAPENPSDCAVPKTSWGVAHNQCQHESQATALTSGDTLLVSASVGNGDIEYSCSTGILQVVDKSCESMHESTSDFSAELKTQSVDWACENVGEGDNSACMMWATSCDSAVINSGLIAVSSGQTPSEAKINDETCAALGFGTMDSHTSLRIEDQTYAYDYYTTRATCSAYSGDEQLLDSCETTEIPVVETDVCQGEQVPTTSSLPKICSGTGVNEVCYENLCAQTVEPSVCTDCLGTAVFTDNATGNTCNVEMGSIPSAMTETISFTNLTYNGVAEVFCNDGNSTATGSCYKSCASGVAIAWGDSSGMSSCGQMIPSNSKGYYTQGQSVSLSASVANNGSATATCDNGNWNITNAVCELDCSGTVSWGSGVDGLGHSKNNLCSATPATISNGETVSVTNVTANATGTALLTCSNGEWSKSNEVCNSSCSAEDVTWGGACEAKSSSKINGASEYLLHSGNSTYVYSDSIEGSATATCSDGKLSVVGSCRYIVSETDSGWGDWVRVSTTCSSSPLASDIPSGTQFVQTETCDAVDRRTRTTTVVWSDGVVVENNPQTEDSSYLTKTYSNKLGTNTESVSVKILQWSQPIAVSKYSRTAGTLTYVPAACLNTLKAKEYPVGLDRSGDCAVEGEVYKYSQLTSYIGGMYCEVTYYESMCEMEDDSDVDVPVEPSLEF